MLLSSSPPLIATATSLAHSAMVVVRVCMVATPADVFCNSS